MVVLDEPRGEGTCSPQLSGFSRCMQSNGLGAGMAADVSCMVVAEPLWRMSEVSRSRP